MKSTATSTNISDIKAVSQFFEEWDWQGPGVIIGIELDAFAPSPERLSTLLRVLKATRTRISNFGAEIPIEYLIAHVNSETAYYSASQPTDRFCHDIERFITVLKK